MSQVTRVYQQIVTPDMAKRLLSINYADNRPIKNWKVKLFCRADENGTWRPEAQTLYICTLPGLPACMGNGQHSMHMHVIRNATYEYTVKEVACQDIDDLRRLYAVLDGDARSDTDKLRALRLDENYNLTFRHVQRINQALSKVIHRFGRLDTNEDAMSEARDWDHRMELFGDYIGESRAYFEMQKGRRFDLKDSPLRATPFALALVTLRHDPERAVDFWTGVMNPIGLPDGDPRLLYSNYLCQDSDIHRSKTGARIQTNDFVMGASTWNLFCAGKTKKTHNITAAYSVFHNQGMEVANTPFSVGPHKDVINAQKREAKEAAKEARKAKAEEAKQAKAEARMVAPANVRPEPVLPASPLDSLFTR